MKSKYTSGKSVGKNQTVPIGVDDPRLKPGKIGQTKARQGAEIDIVGLDGKSLIGGGRTLNNPAGRVAPAPSPTPSPGIVLPPMENKPPKTYPGGSGPVIITPTDPTNVSAVWSGNDLVISFNWDYTNEVNDTVSQFIVELTSDGVTRRTVSNTFKPNTTQTGQTITVTKSMITAMFNIFRTNFSSICVLSSDPLNNISNTICAATVPGYVLDLPVPVVTVTSINNGYSVGYTTPSQDVFDAIDIWEIESTATTAPTITYAADGITPTNYKRSYFDTLNPANVITQNYNKRWVVARFSSDGGIYTSFCAAQSVTPTSPVSIDNTPPDEVSQVSAAWSGDNIVVSYKLPAQNAGSRVQIELTAPNSLVGFFYRFPDGSGRDQTTTITKRDLLDQFGEHYSSFSGVLRSIDAVDNKTPGVSFTVATRTNPLADITPTFTLTPLTNGYSVFATNYATSVGVNYMEVYAKNTPWVGDPTNDDFVVYAGANPAVIINEEYTTIYVKIRYYDDFANTSLYSIEDTVVPMGPGDITSFETPITFGTNGVIYAGGDFDSGHRTVFKTSGIFAYDSSSTSTSTGLTTQIVSDASSGTPTFITTRAQIADWNITDTKIENDLSGAPTKYTGLSATGTYAFWAGSDVSGGNSTSKFTVTPTGEVTAREITIIGNGDPDSELISAGGLFSVKNDGTLEATGATLTGTLYGTGGEFTGNIKLNGGSLYALGTGGTVSSGIRTIFNSSGIAAYNNSGGYAQMLTSPLADGSVFATTAANIGGWKVNANEITKTSLTGGGNITLDSDSGYISVSNSNVVGYTAGINATTSASTSNAFWAGTGGPSSTNNGFRVTLGGQLYATGAAITGGTVTSANGATDIVTMDGVNNLISMQTSGSSTYLFPRNSNTYLTSGNPFPNSGTGDYANMSNLNNNPYFAAGSGFKDYWGTLNTEGIGIFTGAWDYFAGGSSTPFITATTTGLQLSASPTLGLLLDAGTSATGDKLNPAIPTGTPSMLFYTAKKATAPYSPTTEYGAWAAFTNNKIKLTAAETVFVNVDGTVGSENIEIASTLNIWQKFTSSAIRTQISSNVYQEFNSSGIKINAAANTFVSVGTNSTVTLQGSNQVVIGSGIGQGGAFPVGGVSAYEGPSKITLDPTYGVVITGIQVQRDLDMTDAGSGGNYRSTPPLGRYPRSRMLIEDPVTGQVMLGMGVYYRGSGITSTPTSDTGYAGDLLVDF